MTLNIKKYFLSFLGTILIFLITLFIYMMVMTAESIEIFFSNQITSIIIVFMVYSIIIFLLSKIYNDGIYIIHIENYPYRVYLSMIKNM